MTYYATKTELKEVFNDNYNALVEHYNEIEEEMKIRDSDYSLEQLNTYKRLYVGYIHDLIKKDPESEISIKLAVLIQNDNHLLEEEKN